MILDAAAECFAREGFHASSMQDVFAAANVSAGGFYRYFSSKDEVIAALAREAGGMFAGLIDAANASAASHTDFVENLLEGIREFDERTGRARLAVQAWSEAARNARVRELIAGVSVQAEERIAAIVGSNDAARVVLALAQGFVIQRSWGIFGSPRALATAAAELFGSGEAQPRREVGG